jgi:hypothetical protein
MQKWAIAGAVVLLVLVIAVGVALDGDGFQQASTHPTSYPVRVRYDYLK